MPAPRYGSVPDDVPWISGARVRRSSFPPPGRSRVLLVVEDPMLGFSLVGVLEGRFDVELARDASHALAALATTPCDAVIADEDLRSRRGVEFLADVRERYPRVRRIIMTADADPIAAAGEVPDRVLQKPFELEELLEALDDAPSAVAATG